MIATAPVESTVSPVTAAVGRAAGLPPATEWSWSDLPAVELAARSDHSVIWTGSEVIVWGGITTADGWNTFSDGAAYDPATSQWRLIAEAPIAGRGDQQRRLDRNRDDYLGRRP